MSQSILDLILRTKKQGTGVKDAEKEFKSLGDAADALKTPLAGAAAGVAILAGAYQAIIAPTLEYAGEVRELSRNIGATAEESSKLIQAADDMGISVDSLSNALKAAIKNGTQPTIENLSKLSDEYLAIQDPIERSEFLMKKFGKSGLELGALMEQGSEGIRAMGEEAEMVGLVMSEQNVQSARELELALDSLGDLGFAAVIEAGNTLIPILVSAADAMVLLATWGDQVAAAVAQQETNLVTATETYGEYTQKLIEANVAGGANQAAIVKSAMAMGDERDAVTILTEAFGGLSEAEFNVARLTNGTAEEMRIKNEIMNISKTAADDLAAAEAGLSPVWREAKKALDEFNLGQSQKLELQQALALASGEISEADVARQEQVGFLTKQLELGNITQDEYIARIQLMAEGNDTLGLSLGTATTAIATTGDAIEDQFLTKAAEMDKMTRSKLPSAVAASQDAIERYGVMLAKQTQPGDVIERYLIGLAQIEAGYKKITAAAGATPGLPSTAYGSEPPGKALGGPVEAGHMYTVGERGSETFVAPSDGFIIPHGQSITGGGASGNGGGGFGGGHQSISITIPVVLDGREVTRIVVDNIDEALLEKGRAIPNIA